MQTYKKILAVFGLSILLMAAPHAQAAGTEPAEGNYKARMHYYGVAIDYLKDLLGRLKDVGLEFYDESRDAKSLLNRLFKERLQYETSFIKYRQKKAEYDRLSPISKKLRVFPPSEPEAKFLGHPYGFYKSHFLFDQKTKETELEIKDRLKARFEKAVHYVDRDLSTAIRSISPSTNELFPDTGFSEAETAVEESAVSDSKEKSQNSAYFDARKNREREDAQEGEISISGYSRSQRSHSFSH